MANDLNQCNFIGRLGRDPESRFLPDGKAVTNFSIAVGSSWKDKAGEKQESTEWVRVCAFGKLAEICSGYLVKGSQVYISGAMKTRKWQDKDGSDKYSTEIMLDKLHMLGGKPESSESPAPKASKPAANTGGTFDDMDSDIPFN